MSSVVFLEEWRYEQYLEAWEDRFGDEDSGSYGYYRRGKFIPCVVKRLTEEEFRQHVEALKESWAAFDLAYEANDDDAMGQALADSFPHELVLLV